MHINTRTCAFCLLIMLAIALTPALAPAYGAFQFTAPQTDADASVSIETAPASGDDTPSDDDAGIVFSSSVGDDAVVSVPDADSSTASADAPLPLLVNDEYTVSEDYTPDDLVMMADYCDASIVKMKGAKIEGQRVAVDALLEMFSAAIAQGVSSWQISSGWRSVAYQQDMWDNKVYSYRQDGKSGSQARAATARYMARPGASEHHTGLAFDVTVPGEESFVSTEQYRWLAANCWDYGFIIRYTEEKVSITGINAEPWHIRYVGLPHSQIMHETGQCLEEYLGVA